MNRAHGPAWGGRLLAALLCLCAAAGAEAQTPFPMASSNYSEGFPDIASWTNGFASGAGANRWGAVAVNATGTIPNGVRITTATSTFVSGTSGGVQRGTSQTPSTTSLVLLSTGATDNTSADAVDLFLDFTGVNAGTLGFDWASVNNSTGDRKASLRVYTSTDGTTFTELTGAAVLNFTNNSPTSGSVTNVALPASFNNSATARIRFYKHNGSGGTTGSRPKISIDNVAVTATLPTSPAVNGTIASSEYGTHTDGQNQQTSGSQIWYMTWDNTYLYVGITGANTAEGAVLYLDKEYSLPSNGGTDIAGNLLGYTYDGTRCNPLQFRADLVVYFKDGYREYRTADGAGGWSAATSGFGLYGSSGGSVREIAIPWSAAGGRPPVFAWFGYVTSAGGFVYGQVPTENPGGTIGTGARYDRYYAVSATTPGFETKPFSRNSYCFNSAGDVSGFGALSVYDFTMNSGGRLLTRGSGAWNISGSMNISGGTVSFGATSDPASVTKGLIILSGGTLTLSSSAGGDLSVGANWLQFGAFNASSRKVTLNGTAAQDMWGTPVFDTLDLNNAAGLTLNDNIRVNQKLRFTAGKIATGADTLIVGPGGAFEGAGAGKYVQGNLRMEVPTGTTVARNFEMGDAASYAPVNVSFASVSAPGSVTGRTAPGEHPQIGSSGLDPSRNVNRTWTLANQGVGFTTYDATFGFVPGDVDVAANTANFAVKRYNGASWNGTTTGNRTSTSTQATGVTAFSDFAVGEELTYTIETIVSGNGTIAPPGPVSVTHGGSQGFTITADPGNHIDSVVAGGVNQGPVGTYTFTNVTANDTIRAYFSPNVYTIQTIVSGSGAIAPPGPVSV
ncbi:MAG: hypothetical protein WB626_04145, partial [Bacteroidota bacterium]